MLDKGVVKSILGEEGGFYKVYCEGYIGLMPITYTDMTLKSELPKKLIDDYEAGASKKCKTGGSMDVIARDKDWNYTIIYSDGHEETVPHCNASEDIRNQYVQKHKSLIMSNFKNRIQKIIDEHKLNDYDGNTHSERDSAWEDFIRIISVSDCYGDLCDIAKDLLKTEYEIEFAHWYE